VVIKSFCKSIFH